VAPTGRRPYPQYCGLARALDVVGDRWALLVLRELTLGPRRYTDLLDGLPGASTDMLAARLRDLEKAGAIRRRVLPPPAASKVYELTRRGHDLEPVLQSLAVWGTDLLTERRDGDAFQARWLSLQLRGRFRPDHAEGVRLTIRFVVDGDTLSAVIDAGHLTILEHDTDDPDVTITGSPEALTAAIATQDTAPSDVHVEGRPTDVRTMLRVLGLSPG
jgi:DNA-binding HxlR family transcriptional regulator